ncbi:MAG: hypothetical protein K1X75_12165 [Leptospirales bacterium]|nr:hypothetical protein [Leptospirales bacterium]
MKKSSIWILSGLLVACSAGGKSNREKAVELISSLQSGDHAPIAYINPDKYIQHNINVGDGMAGFGELMQHKPPQGFKARVVRSFQDGDYVVLHSEYDFFGPKIGFDIFRFEDGRIVEHWDNLQETTAVGRSGHSMIDGPTEVSDQSRTESNKELVRKFYDVVLIGGDLSRVGEYLDASYIQHNPMIPDGTQPLIDARTHGVFSVTRTHLLLGEGNFVLVQSEGMLTNKPVIFYDLFRIADGKIVEHWDTIEFAVPREQWRNSNGKF